MDTGPRNSLKFYRATAKKKNLSKPSRLGQNAGPAKYEKRAIKAAAERLGKGKACFRVSGPAAVAISADASPGI